MPGVTRLAPSPTGALHLGNARTFLINWAVARQMHLRLLLRIDDLDGPRIKPGASDAVRRDLHWLGIEWDEEVSPQTARVDYYEAALQRLCDGGYCFDCACSRSQVIENSSGQSDDGAWIYGGPCERQPLTAVKRSTRLRVGGDVQLYHWSGDESKQPVHRLGAFPIHQVSTGVSYQLASAVDDLSHRVTHIVRGEDLFESSVRQTYLRQLLAAEAEPIRHLHLPLVVGTDNRKLAKRHGDTRVATCRQQGWSAGRVRSLVGQWSGIEHDGDELSADDWLDRFRLDRVPRSSIIFNPAAVELS